MKEFTKSNLIEFAQFLLDDYEMSNFDDAEKTMCWVLAGTNQKYTAKEIADRWDDEHTAYLIHISREENETEFEREGCEHCHDIHCAGSCMDEDW